MAETSVQAGALAEVLNNCILGCQKQDWQTLDTIIDLLVRTYQIEARRITLENHIIQKIYELFNKVDFVTLKDHLHLHFSIVANIFRLLRNCCAGNPRNVQMIYRQGNLLPVVMGWLRYFTDRELHDTENPNYEKMLVPLKCCLQFLANAVGGQVQSGDPARRFIWHHLDLNMRRKLLAAEDPGVRKITTAVIYHFLLDEAIFATLIGDIAGLVALFDAIILELRTDDPSEWSSFIIQRILERPITVDDVLRRIPIERSINFIEEMTNMLIVDNSEDRPARISEFNLIPLFRLLKQNLIDLKVERPANERNPRCLDLILALLKLACEVTANDKSKYSFLEDTELFKLTSTVLNIIHKVYKQYLLRDVNVELPASIAATIQLKKHLVRLIANLAYNRPSMQNLANRIDTVPLVLDLASYDFHNPFIREYSILAINNLLKNHPANQSIVRSMFRQNIANSTLLSQEIKLTLNNLCS